MQQRRTGGRPKRDEAAQRDERVLEVATGMFFRSGFEATSIDSIATAGCVGKPSLYAKYGDKNGLFLAVLRRAIGRCVMLFPEASAAHGSRLSAAELASALTEVGLHVLRSSVTPDAISLRRVLVSECERCPELAEILHQEGWMRGVRHVVALLESAVDFERSAVNDPELAADLFLSLVLGRLPGQAMLGIAIDPDSFPTRVAAAVKLFLGSALKLR